MEDIPNRLGHLVAADSPRVGDGNAGGARFLSAIEMLNVRGGFGINGKEKQLHTFR